MSALQEFQNELGHNITLEVSAKEIEGVAGVLISIAGPSSHTELHITQKEAKMLTYELTQILQDK